MAAFPKKPLPASCAVAKKEKGELQVVGKLKDKLQEAELLYPEAHTGKDTNSHTPLPVPKMMPRPATRRKSQSID